MVARVKSVLCFLKEDYFMSDAFLATFLPLLVYWVYSGIYMMMGSLKNLEKYRLHPIKDEETKNLVSKREVIGGVLVQQAVQTTILVVIFMLTEMGKEKVSEADPPTPLIVLFRQFLVALVFTDTWQYFTHRYMHSNKFLYRHVHLWHHNLIVPYAFGALYVHPGDAILDTVGAGLSLAVSGMSPRLSIFFFSFLIIKVVDDHCGLLMPGNVIHMIFSNTTAFHNSHHLLYGNKYNFGQPFFLWWDKMLGTYMTYNVVKRPGGGFEIRPAKELED